MVGLMSWSITEPLLPTQPEEIADLGKLVSTPIALGERLYSRFDFRPYLERRAIDIAQPDVGGVPRSCISPLLTLNRSLIAVALASSIGWQRIRKRMTLHSRRTAL